MKQLFFSLILSICILGKANAQELDSLKNYNRWSVAALCGVNYQGTHFLNGSYSNFNFGVRGDYHLSPIWAIGLEGMAYVGNHGQFSYGKSIVSTNINVIGTCNLMNLFSGYHGSPRKFEVDGLVGFGWGHFFSDIWPYSDANDDGTFKFGFDFAYNLGNDRQWKLFLEPALIYELADGDNKKTGLNFSHSLISVSLGATYSF